MTRKGPIALTLILFALVACAPDSPEDELVDAAEDVADVQDRIQAADNPDDARHYRPGTGR